MIMKHLTTFFSFRIAGLQTRSKEMVLYVFLSIVHNDIISVVPEIVDEMISQYKLNYTCTKNDH